MVWEATEISSLRCSEEAWVVEEDQEDHRKARVLNTQSKLLLKKFITQRKLRSQSVEIESARFAMVEVAKTELTPLALVARVEVKELK